MYNHYNNCDSYYWDNTNNDDTESKYQLCTNFLSSNDIREIELILNNCEQYQEDTLELKNYRLISLPKELKKFNWVKQLDVSYCHLTELDNLPINLEHLDASNNKISIIKKNELPVSLKSLMLEDNIIGEIEELPSGLVGLHVGNNILSEINVENTELEYLNLSKNKFTKIPKLNNKIIKLDVSENIIDCVDDLPNSLEQFDCSNNNISLISNLPKNIIELVAYANSIEYIYYFPENIKTIDLSNNNISYIPSLPNSIEQIDLSHNKLKSLSMSDLPSNLTKINVKNNENLNMSSALQDDPRILHNINTYNYYGNRYSNEYDKYYGGYNEYASYYGNRYSNNYGNYGTLNSDYNTSCYNDYGRNSYGSSYSSLYNSINRSNYGIETTFSKYSEKNPYYIVMKRKIEI